MNKLKSKQILAVLALLGSSIASAATITIIPSVANPVLPGTNFFVTIHADATMPVTTGATLDVSWNPLAISIGTAQPVAPNFNFAVFTPTGAGTGLISCITTSASGVAGPFDACTLNMTSLAPGLANLMIFEGDPDKGWSDVEANNWPGITYEQAIIATPVPAAAWLFVSAVGGLAALKRRQKA